MKKVSIAVITLILIVSSITCFAHLHDYRVVGKDLYNVRQGGTHTYQSGIATDPITGQQTPTYGTCYYSYKQYRGIWTCECGSTRGYYYYPDEEVHSSCPLSGR